MIVKLINITERLNKLCKKYDLRTVAEMMIVLKDKDLEDERPQWWIDRWETELHEHCFQFMNRDTDDDDEQKIIYIQLMVRKLARILKLHYID